MVPTKVLFCMHVKKKWGVKTVAYEHNDMGLKFAEFFKCG